MIRCIAGVATFIFGAAVYSGPLLAENVGDTLQAAPAYAVSPPRDFADVKLAYANIGSQALAANPKNANVFLAGYVFRAFYSLQSSCWVRASNNAGRTWAAAKKLPMPAGNPYCDRSALAWAPDGSRVYAAYSYWSRDADGAGVVISSSTDKGLTWSPPRIVARFTDRNSIGASVKLATPVGASDSRWVYILMGETTYLANPAAYYFARSDDRGQTWTPPQVILGWSDNEGPANATIAIAGGLGGEILISYGYVICDSPTCLNESHNIGVSHSSDHGVHFQDHVVAVPNTVGTTAVAIGTAGTAHIVYTPWYEDSPAFGPYYVYSTKAPYTVWSQPIALNADSPALYVGDPALTVSGCGSGTSVLHVVWLEPIGSGKYDVSYARKLAKTGEEWSPKLRLSGSKIDYSSTPAIAAGGSSAIALWGSYYNNPAWVRASRIATGVSCP